MIPRLLEKPLFESLTHQPQIHLLLGARQVGKTTLLLSLREKLEKDGKKILYFNCDLAESLKAVDTNSLTVLQNLLKTTDFLFLDEAQRLTNPGLTLKIIYDNIPNIKILATGSSSFDLKNKTAETLTGRFLDFTLFPFSVKEVTKHSDVLQFLLPSFLLYGFYPQIYLTPDPSQKRVLLQKIAESYLFRDILSFQRIRRPQAIIDLAKALAYQIGNEVNENELANRLKIDRKTVVSYLDILEKGLVTKRLYPFSKNPRREIGRNYKVYFLDLGIRNSLIDDFNELPLRNDIGSMFENFLIIERLKKFANQNQMLEIHFWRSYGGAEIDYLEEQNGSRQPFEFKYSAKNLSRGASSFTKKYQSKVKLVNRENFPEFI